MFHRRIDISRNQLNVIHCSLRLWIFAKTLESRTI